jgi:cyanophycinase
MALTAWVPRIRNPRQEGTAGLGLLPHLRVIPHFDLFAARGPEMLERFFLPYDPGITVVGVEEDTAMVGGPREWTVQGRQSVWRLSQDEREQIAAGTTLTTPGSPF